MSGPAEVAIAAGILVDSGLKATVLLGVGWSATRLMHRGSAAQRHAVWVATFAALPLLPLFAAWRGAEIALDIPWLVAVWAVGFVLSAAPIVRGLVALEFLRRRATPSASCRDLLHSDDVSAPITWGLIRPVILLPTCANRWSSTNRSAALAHERAHIARRDWAVHLAAWGVNAVFWFHPLVWWARLELAREAEHAADDVVLDLGIRPSEYASLLVSLAAPQPPPAALGVSSSLVGQRVHAVLDTRSRSARRWPAWAVALTLGVLSFPALAAWPTWSAPEQALTCAPGPHP